MSIFEIKSIITDAGPHSCDLMTSDVTVEGDNGESTSTVKGAPRRLLEHQPVSAELRNDMTRSFRTRSVRTIV